MRLSGKELAHLYFLKVCSGGGQGILSSIQKTEMNEVFGNIKIFTTRETALLYYVKRFSNVPMYLKT